MSKIYGIRSENKTSYESHPEPRGFIIRLMFDVFNNKGDFLGVESWYLGDDNVEPESYRAQMFFTEENAVGQFYSCYQTVIKRFLRSCTGVVYRQWDGFAHIEQVYTKTIRTDQFDPIDINNAVKYKIS